MEPPRPKVGIGLLLIKNGKVLLAQRIGSHGKGEYGGPGGHMENMESFEDTVLREMAEECGDKLRIKSIKFLCLTNLRKYAPKHYIDIGMTAEWVSGEPKQMEPHKLGPWQWYDIDKLPTPLFGVEPNYVEAYKTGKIYFTE